jgi:acyl-CoA dehydrogenase
MTNHTDTSEFSDAAARFFEEVASPLQRISDAVDPATIWAMLEDMMFPSAWMRETDGGVGMSAKECGQIVETAGRFAFDTCLIDTIVSRRWAGEAGVSLPENEPVSYLPARLGDRISIDATGTLSGVLRDVTGSSNFALVLADGPAGTVLARADLRQADTLSRRPGPRGAVRTLQIDGVKAVDRGQAPVSSLLVHASAAAFSASWIAGALRGLLNLCIAYAHERVAFGRKIAKFQAIQHNLARLGAETASAEVAARTALLALDDGCGVFESAVAKVRADSAGREGSAIAHQLFGAIGFTVEHPLHLYTGQIAALRDVHGAGPEWAALVGRSALGGSGRELWPMLTDGVQFGSAMEKAFYA